jgi:hypothetical protein
MKTAPVTAGFLLAFASASAHAQLQSRPVPVRAVESFTFQSPSMGVRFSLNVGLPQGYTAGDGKKYPALIVDTRGRDHAAVRHQRRDVARRG